MEIADDQWSNQLVQHCVQSSCQGTRLKIDGRVDRVGKVLCTPKVNVGRRWMMDLGSMTHISCDLKWMAQIEKVVTVVKQSKF